ncbi:MAG: hypothetical protein HYU02_05500 [Thaumarchaeota archaeon]|nr:hypothetical protein [Nitrososphaerota archaeon]
MSEALFIFYALRFRQICLALYNVYSRRTDVLNTKDLYKKPDEISLMDARKTLIIENISKNIVLIILLALLFKPLQNVLSEASLADAGSILSFASLTLVAALFGNFAFTYEFSNVKNKAERLLAHSTTFLLMLAVGLLLETSTIVISIRVNSLLPLATLISAIVYSASVLYDFWDLLRAKI